MDWTAEIEAPAAYRKARQSWADFSARAKSVYAADISYGRPDFRRGNWADRLAAIDADLVALNAYYKGRVCDGGCADERGPAVQRVFSPTPRPTIDAHHTPPDNFHPGNDLAVVINTPHSSEAILWYRHVTHGERWRSMPMQHTESRAGNAHTAVIPADYTNSPYPLQYYFELRTANAAALHPPFNSTWSNQPYYAIHKRT